MKKIMCIFLVCGIFIFGILLSSCVGTAAISDDYIVLPDPNNLFQGTWVTTVGSVDYMHVINGMNGTFYIRSGIYARVWQRQAVYIIERKENGYMTSNNWRINVTNNILAVENTTYERFVKQ